MFEVRGGVDITPIEYEFYKIAKQQPKPLLDAYGEKVVSELEWAQNRVRSILGYVRQYGFKNASEVYPKEQIKLVYPEFSNKVINAEKTMVSGLIQVNLKE